MGKMSVEEVRALVKLGDSYLNGDGVSVDKIMAAKCYEKAAKMGDAEAQCNYGRCFARGEGVRQNWHKANKWYLCSANQGYARAQCNLAGLYIFGHGVEQNIDTAIRYLRLSIDGGFVNANAVLGDLYYWGNGVPENKELAIGYYKTAAEYGDPVAQYNLGDAYLNGDGVPVNQSEGFRWIERASKQGNAMASCQLGHCYMNGIGTEENIDKAVILFSLAADQMDDEALAVLGCLYQEGIGVTKDLVKSVEYLRKASELGNPIGQYNLGCCYYWGNGVPQDYEKAFSCFKSAAENGFFIAEHNVGLCYYFGDGVEKNYSLAKKWFEPSASRGFIASQLYLGLLHLNETYSKRNVEQALFWLEKAATGDSPEIMIQGFSCELIRVLASLNLSAQYYEQGDREKARYWLENIGTIDEFGFLYLVLSGCKHLVKLEDESESIKIKVYESFRKSLLLETQWKKWREFFGDFQEVAKQGIEVLVSENSKNAEVTNLDCKIGQMDYQEVLNQTNGKSGDEIQRAIDSLVEQFNSAMRKVLEKMPSQIEGILRSQRMKMFSSSVDYQIAILQTIGTWDSDKSRYDTFLINAIKKGRGIPLRSKEDECLRLDEDETLELRSPEARKVIAKALEFSELGYDINSDYGLEEAIKIEFPNYRERRRDRIFNEVRQIQKRVIREADLKGEESEEDSSISMDGFDSEQKTPEEEFFEKIQLDEAKMALKQKINAFDESIVKGINKFSASAFMTRYLFDEGCSSDYIKELLSETRYFSEDMDWLIDLLEECKMQNRNLESKYIAERLGVLDSSYVRTANNLKEKISNFFKK